MEAKIEKFFNSVGSFFMAATKFHADHLITRIESSYYHFVGYDSDAYDAAATDVLAGMDQAIEDGVDIMSLSLGFFETPFFENPIAIGAFAAIRKGIFVACSAGNGGPHGYTMLNGAPWITTVGAGTVDRQFAAHITLGDGVMTITGQSFYPENLFVSRVPVYFGHGNRSKELCDYNALNHKEVAGKFIFCDYDNESSVCVMVDF